MKKELSALVLILLIIISGFSLISVQSVPVNLPNQGTSVQPDIHYYLDETNIDEELVTELLNTITIGDILDDLQLHIHDRMEKSSVQDGMLRSVERGIQTLETDGFTPDMTLGEALSVLERAPQANGETKYRPYVIGILPIRATVSTLLPSYEINLSDNYQLGIPQVKLEFFIKIIPILDTITVRQLRILQPSITQTTRIWPAIGGRITVFGFTIFILAFGPRVRWTYSSLLGIN